ncbi:ArdC family protein [Myxococcota bacterium]
MYQVITTKIVELLEKGTVPWKKPWTNGPAAKSYRGYEYRGINRMLLSTIASLDGLKGCWITFNQAKKAGGKVKKGAKGIPVVFWKWIHPKKRSSDEEQGPLDHSNTAGSRRKKDDRLIPLCRYYTVFSICQTEGVEEPSWLSKVEAPRNSFEAVKAAEEIWDGYQDAPVLTHSGDQAAYFPSKDTILMPQKEQFRSPEDYYSTMFHEMTHSTGHDSRLDRFKSCEHVPFGSDSYSREELVAEMGAAFLAGEAGINSYLILQNSAAYLQSWIRVLKAEPRMAVIAAAQAQKSCDYILGRKYEYEPE